MLKNLVVHYFELLFSLCYTMTGFNSLYYEILVLFPYSLHIILFSVTEQYALFSLRLILFTKIFVKINICQLSTETAFL